MKLMAGLVVGAALLAAAGTAASQTPPVTKDVIVHAKDRPMMTVYSWARNGKFTSAFPGDKIEVPYDAAKIDVRIVPFANGMVRLIHFDAGVRTHPNVAHEDILFYQITGRRVQIINDRSSEVNPGDASIQISGVRKRQDQIIAGDMVEFAMPRPKRTDGEGIWVKAGDVQPVQVRDPSGSTYPTKTFKLDRYEMHEVRLAKGDKMAPRTQTDDTYFFVASGKLNATIGATKGVAETYDVMQAPAGTPFGFEAAEDTLLVYAPIPKAAPAAAAP
jgi:quercetin dioxygenase-like cupin family protein